MRVAESPVESNSPKQNDREASSISPEEPEVSSHNSNSLTVNKRFVVNTLKQAADHNRIKTNKDSKLLRKFQNEERKKHTLKNLDQFSAQKTLYSDFFGGCGAEADGTSKKPKQLKRTKIITPLEQVKKLVSDAAEFDEEQENMLNRVVRKPRFLLDKRLLNNHLQHYSVHNRLMEENEMWDKHKSQKERKTTGLQTKSSKSLNSGTYGGMYADREPGNVKVTRVKETPDQAKPPRFGPATRVLLEFEESIPDRWDRGGFKEMYQDELNEDDDSCENPEGESSRKIIISNSLSDRLNSSIELSDDDVKIVSSNKRLKLGSRIVVNKLKRKLKENPRKIKLDEPICVEKVVATKKKSVVTVVPKAAGNHKPTKLVPFKPVRPVKQARKKERVGMKRSRLGTLQADLIVDEEKTRRGIKRASSPRWGHDGYREINVDDDDEPVRKNAKSRLDVMSTMDNDDDSEVSIDFPKRREIVTVKENKNQANKFKEIPSIKRTRETKIQLSDSDEWTEKEVDSSLPKNDARRKLRQNKTEETVVNRDTLKNSIHERDKSAKGRHVLSGKQQSKRINNNNESLDGDKRKTVHTDHRKRTLSENDDGSSFTDSSSDERYKRRVDVKKQRDKRFNNNRR